MSKTGRLSLLAIGAALVFAAILFALPGENVWACGGECPPGPSLTPPTQEPLTCDELLEQIAEYQDRVDNYEDRYQYWHLRDQYTVAEYLAFKQQALMETQAQYDLLCTEEEPTATPPPDEDDDDPPPGDCPWCDPAAPIVFYTFDDRVEIYSMDGQPLVIGDPDFFNSLPTSIPATNTELWRSDDGLIVLYRLSTGEYQFNYGPDATGYVNILIFDVFPYVFIYDYQYYYE